MILTVEQLIKLLSEVDPQAGVYLMDTGTPVALSPSGVQICEDEEVFDVDGLSVPVGSVVLV